MILLDISFECLVGYFSLAEFVCLNLKMFALQYQLTLFYNPKNGSKDGYSTLCHKLEMETSFPKVG